MNNCKVWINDKEVFTGTHAECCAYITESFTIEQYNIMSDYIEIIYHGGRLASHVLEWK